MMRSPRKGCFDVGLVRLVRPRVPAHPQLRAETQVGSCTSDVISWRICVIAFEPADTPHGVPCPHSVFVTARPRVLDASPHVCSAACVLFVASLHSHSSGRLPLLLGRRSGILVGGGCSAGWLGRTVRLLNPATIWFASPRRALGGLGIGSAAMRSSLPSRLEICAAR